jgi:hypothetical protein
MPLSSTQQRLRRDLCEPPEQHVVPRVDRAGQAPVQAVAGVPDPAFVVVPARVAVGAQHHRLGDVQQLKLGAAAGLPHPRHLLALHPPQLPPDAPRIEVAFLQRPRPVAVAATEPGTVLEVVGRVGAHEGDEAVLAVPAPGDGLERRADDAADGVGDAQVREAGLAAVDAADPAAVLPQVVDAEEPVAAGDDRVVQPRQAAGPVGVEPVEVDVEGGGGLAAGVEHRLAARVELRPHRHEREVVRREVPRPELVEGVAVHVRGRLGLHASHGQQPHVSGFWARAANRSGRTGGPARGGRAGSPSGCARASRR